MPDAWSQDAAMDPGIAEAGLSMVDHLVGLIRHAVACNDDAKMADLDRMLRAIEKRMFN